MVNNINLPWWTVPIGIACNFALIGIGQGVFGNDATIENASLSYLQPDPTTFSVWAIIYSFQVCLTIYQSLPSNRNCPRLMEARAPLIGNYLTNGLWLVANGAANKGLSFWLAVVVLAANVFCLYRVYRILRIDYGCKKTSWKRKVFAYMAISTNLSWVVLASILNFTNTLFKPENVAADPVQIGSADWAIAVVGLACVLASYLGFLRTDVGYVGVFAWACGGIARAQNTKQEKFLPTELSSTLGTFALAAMGFALLCLVLGIVFTVTGWGKNDDEDDLDHPWKTTREDYIMPCKCDCCHPKSSSSALPGDLSGTDSESSSQEKAVAA